jgi:hypothetical protein
VKYIITDAQRNEEFTVIAVIESDAENRFKALASKGSNNEERLC